MIKIAIFIGIVMITMIIVSFLIWWNFVKDLSEEEFEKLIEHYYKNNFYD